MSEKVHTVAQVRDEVRSLIKSRVDAYTEELKNLRHRELAKSESEVCALCGNMEADSDCSCKVQKSAVTHFLTSIEGDLQTKLEYIESKVSKDPSISVRDAQKDIKERFGTKAYNKAVTDTLRQIKAKARKRKKMQLAQSEMPVAKEEMSETSIPQMPVQTAKKSRLPGGGRTLAGTRKADQEIKKDLVPDAMSGAPMTEAEMPESKGPKTGSVAKLNAVLHRKATEKNCGSYTKNEQEENDSN